MIEYVGIGNTKTVLYSQPSSSPTYKEMQVTFNSGDIPGSVDDYVVFVTDTSICYTGSGGNQEWSFDPITQRSAATGVTEAGGTRVFRTTFTVVAKSDIVFPLTSRVWANAMIQGSGVMSVTPFVYACDSPITTTMHDWDGPEKLPYAGQNEAVSADDRTTGAISTVTSYRAYFPGTEYGVLVSGYSPSATISTTLNTASTAPGSSRSNIYGDILPGSTRVRNGDRLYVMIEASASDPDKVFTVRSSAGTWTRIYNETLTSARYELWTINAPYSGVDGDSGWTSWSGSPIVDAVDGTGSSFKACVIAVRGNVSLEYGKWTTTATPTYPTAVMPSLSSTSMTTAIITGLTYSGGTPLNVPMGWTGAASLSGRTFVHRQGGTGSAAAPGFLQISGAVGNSWLWTGFTVAQAVTPSQPSSPTLQNAEGYTLRYNHNIDMTPPDFPIGSFVNQGIQYWSQRGIATNLYDFTAFQPNPVWQDSPQSNVKEAQIFSTFFFMEEDPDPPPVTEETGWIIGSIGG